MWNWRGLQRLRENAMFNDTVERMAAPLSREAATECSPRRKPWEQWETEKAPAGRKISSHAHSSAPVVDFPCLAAFFPPLQSYPKLSWNERTRSYSISSVPRTSTSAAAGPEFSTQYLSSFCDI